MQNITIAIGKTGIQFFTNSFLIHQILGLLGQLTPPNKTIGVPNIKSSGMQAWYDYSNITVTLSGGGLTGFNPTFRNLSQANQTFTLLFEADNFNAFYSWLEAYTSVYVQTQATYPYIYYNPPQQESTQLKYGLSMQSLQISVAVQFAYDQTAHAWEISVGSVSPTLNGVVSNIPSSSILVGGCGGDNITPATEQAIDSVDFAGPINQLITGILKTIPGSGNLGDGIQYDFTIGDSGLLFPGSDGIQMGISGGASYKGSAFPGAPPAALPLPAPLTDADTHHLNMFVGGYEVNALNWAYFQAGKLNTVVNAVDLPDPDVLKVQTYTPDEPALVPYHAFAMQAQVTQSAAPVISFQTIYELSAAVMTALQTQLPQNEMQRLSGLQGNNYASKADLEADLTAAGIDASYFSVIENAARSGNMMLVTHDINYTLVIQNFQPDPPNIVFNIKRVDVLNNLALGVGPNQAQTMQFGFQHVSYGASFISSTVPNFNGANFPSVWNVAGEAQYDQLLAAMGGSGVPLPIMQNLQFDFANAVLSIQEGYVSILANVLYKS